MGTPPTQEEHSMAGSSRPRIALAIVVVALAALVAGFTAPQARAVDDTHVTVVNDSTRTVEVCRAVSAWGGMVPGDYKDLAAGQSVHYHDMGMVVSEVDFYVRWPGNKADRNIVIDASLVGHAWYKYWDGGDIHLMRQNQSRTETHHGHTYTFTRHLDKKRAGYRINMWTVSLVK
jgi:hypothetical protein